MDLAPTILAMAGVSHPAATSGGKGGEESRGKGVYKGREVVSMRGVSWVDFLKGEKERIHPADFIHGWETCGRAAIRHGDWKAVFIPAPKGPERWQLYNLALDPGEVRDLSEKPEQEERMKSMMKLWDQYVLETGVVPLAPEMGKWLQATEEQMTEDTWIAYRYWEEGAREAPEKFTKTPMRFERQEGRVEVKQM